MRLAIPSLVLFIYLVASLVAFVPCRPLVKTLVGIALFAGGLYEASGMKLYVSPGTGQWAGFSSRLGVPSEITHIILRSQAKG